MMACLPGIMCCLNRLIDSVGEKPVVVVTLAPVTL